VSYLLGRGHRLQDVWGYTLRQIDALVSLGHKEETRQQVSMVWGNRIAYHADGKDYSRIMKQLQG
jgi:hypothetical protein